MAGGADAVVMVEETARGDAEHAAIVAEAAARQNIGRKGTDISPGDLAVRRGDLLDPSRLGAVAAIGCSRLDVFARPRVAMLSTGNEVIEPGTPLGSGKLYDVKRFTLAAVVATARLPLCAPPAFKGSGEVRGADGSVDITGSPAPRRSGSRAASTLNRSRWPG